MLRNRRWTWAAAWLWLVLRVGAWPEPEWSATVWQIDDGLPDNRISGLVQTATGELWVGTRSGLARFNGRHFDTFRLDQVPGVRGRGLIALFGDSRDRFWIGAVRDVIVCLDHTSAAIYGREEGVPTGELIGMAEAADGTVWLAVDNHVGRIVDGQFRPIAFPRGETGSLRAALCRDDAGRVWCFANGQLGLLDATGFVPRATLPYRDVALGRAGAGGVWIAADTQVLRCDDDGLSAVALALPDDAKPRSVLEDRDGALWIGTGGHGLFRWTSGRPQPIETTAPEVGQLLEDREGNIWAGTEGGGLHRLQLGAIELLGPPAGLPQAAIYSVCQDATGTYWAVSSTGQLLRSDGARWLAVPLGPLTGGASATCVAAGPRGKLWIGTRERGLLEMDLSSGAIRPWNTADGLPSNALVGLYPAKDGSVWFATREPNGFGQLHRDGLRTLPVPSSVRIVRAIVEDAAGTIWAGTSDGQILQVAGDRLVPEPTLAAQVLPGSVRTLLATPDGSLWIGFATQGIGLYRDGHYTTITTAQGLIEEGVWQMAADRQGSIWIAGQRGWYRLPMADLLKAAANPAERLRPAAFRRSGRLPTAQAHFNNLPAVCVGRDGNILFATNLGLMSLHPALLLDHPVPPAVTIDRVTVDDQIVAARDSGYPLRPTIEPHPLDTGAAGAHLVLPPDHQRLTFKFAARDYRAAENVRYRYRLEGAEDTWTETTRDATAHYSRLPAGDYRFRVAAGNGSGAWDEHGASLAVTVGAFYWQTWWFRLAAGTVFTALITAIVRFVSVRRLQARLRAVEQQSALLQERTRIARDIHDDLGGSLTHIKLLSELAVQSGHAPGEIEASVRQITQTTQEVMRSLDEIVWAVNPRNDTLPHLISYLGQHAAAFLRAAGIGCTLELPEDPPEIAVRSDVRHHLFLALKEALTNIARHSGARHVQVRVELDDASLVVGVQDDGCSFAAAPDDALADGLRNMRQRLEAVGGSFTIEARPGHGTDLRFVVPLRPAGG